MTILLHRSFADRTGGIDAACIEIAIGKQHDRLSCENSTIYRWRIWFQRLCTRNQISSLDFNKKGWLPHVPAKTEYFPVNSCALLLVGENIGNTYIFYIEKPIFCNLQESPLKI